VLDPVQRGFALAVLRRLERSRRSSRLRTALTNSFAAAGRPDGLDTVLQSISAGAAVDDVVLAFVFEVVRRLPEDVYRPRW
jgi:hypothetical protein